MNNNYKTFYLLTQYQIDLGNYVTLNRRFTNDGFVVESIQTFNDIIFDRMITQDAYYAQAKQKGDENLGEGEQESWKTF